MYFRQKINVASLEGQFAASEAIEKSEKTEKTPLQSEEVKYWSKLLKAFLQPSMILLFIAAAIRHTGEVFFYLFIFF